MRREEAFEKAQESSFKEILGEMGYSEDSNDFMYINMKEGIKIARDGRVGSSDIEQLGGGLSFKETRTNAQGMEYHNMSDQEFFDMECKNEVGQKVPGLVASNNGVYSAYLAGRQEMIVTKNPKIIQALQKQMHFSDNGPLPTPFSNGDRPASLNRELKLREVEAKSSDCKEPQRLKSKAEKQEDKNRQALMSAIQGRSR
ncbi:MAG: hypothetical protein IJ752_02340 [Alphaproteobacteria bacterium]|nr:hypothetical protein [Alphaproteobacteria bacterium]